MEALEASLRPTQARRCLFERPDPVETDNYLNSELAKIKERHREQWNFDFDKEQPLEGDWQWVKVEPEMSRLVQTAERTQTGESVGTASAGRRGAKPLLRAEIRASRTRQSSRVEDEATETERDAPGLASRLSGEKPRSTSDHETAEAVSLSKRTGLPRTVVENSKLRRSPRRKPTGVMSDFYSVKKKRYSSCSDVTMEETSSKKKANQTPIRHSQRLSEKQRRRDTRPRSLSFVDSCSPTSC